MNWKKISLFALLLIAGAFLFLGISMLSLATSLIITLFFATYAIFLLLAVINYSNKKLIVLILIIAVYAILMFAPFTKCSYGYLGSTSVQDCTCLGIKKDTAWVTEVWSSQCIGISKDYTCYNQLTREKTEGPC